MRALLLAALLAVAPAVGDAAQLSVLHIQVQLADTDGTLIPMPRVVLLISDNPATAEPKRVTTTSNGTIDVTLRAGNYTIETDQPVAFQGKAYQWTQVVDVAGATMTVALTARNAEIGEVASSTKSIVADSAIVLAKRQESVVEVWTPTAHASGFLIDARGLVATNQRAVGTATAVEVQIGPSIKVKGQVLAADRVRDVSIIWVDPTTAASMTPVPIACAPAPADITARQELVAIVTPLLARKQTATGTLAELSLSRGSTGGPVFTVDGTLVGLATDDERERAERGDVRVIPIGQACDVITAAEKKMAGATAPSGTRLPVEPLSMAASVAGPAIAPITVPSSADFDITIFPPMPVRDRRGAGRAFDFGNWTDYVMDTPPMLYVRVTPKFEESLMMTIARGAAQTQGVALPPIRRFKASFFRMSAYCGDVEVTPIHPLTIERRLDEKDEKNRVVEGLYVFAPGALGPQCVSARLVLWSEKEPAKSETKTLGPDLLKLLPQ